MSPSARIDRRRRRRRRRKRSLVQTVSCPTSPSTSVSRAHIYLVAQCHGNLSSADQAAMEARETSMATRNVTHRSQSLFRDVTTAQGRALHLVHLLSPSHPERGRRQFVTPPLLPKKRSSPPSRPLSKAKNRGGGMAATGDLDHLSSSLEDRNSTLNWASQSNQCSLELHTLLLRLFLTLFHPSSHRKLDNRLDSYRQLQKMQIPNLPTRDANSK